jgi:hypothetical protein
MTSSYDLWFFPALINSLHIYSNQGIWKVCRMETCGKFIIWYILLYMISDHLCSNVTIKCEISVLNSQVSYFAVYDGGNFCSNFSICSFRFELHSKQVKFGVVLLLHKMRCTHEWAIFMQQYARVSLIFCNVLILPWSQLVSVKECRIWHLLCIFLHGWLVYILNTVIIFSCNHICLLS